MKGIIITERNYRQVAGRLKKFFKHKRYSVWSDWNCGMKKRIQKNECGYIPPINFSQVNVTCNNNLFIINLSDKISIPILWYDEILFLGNRIIIKKLEGYIYGIDYAYICIQNNNSNIFQKYEIFQFKLSACHLHNNKKGELI